MIIEIPKCNFCGSDSTKHTTIFVNVKNTEHNLVECQICHLRFYSPRMPFWDYLQRGYGQNKAAEEEAERMYKNASFTPVKNSNQQKIILKSYYKWNILNKIIKINPNIKTCYEIGGSVGWLSHFLKEEHPNIITDGCELNHYSVKIANEKFGLNFSVGAFESAITKENYYDIVLALDYIEHTFTPFDDLKKSYTMLKDKGLIVIKTFLEDLDINRTMEAPIGHTHHFFGYVLKEMIQKSGFKIIYENIQGIQTIIIGQK